MLEVSEGKACKLLSKGHILVKKVQVYIKKLCCYIYLCVHAYGIPAIGKNITQYSLGLLRQNCLLSVGDHLITHHGHSFCRPVAISVIGGGLYSCSQILKTIDFKIN